MQLEHPPVGPNPAVTSSPGFTFVEEDDVAFALGLCREVNRIYGDYHEGRLAASDPVLAALMVTVEMLAALSRTVKDGMPGMRITVAAAQTREMLAVTFDQDPMQIPPPSVRRRHYRSVVAEGGRALAEARPGPRPGPGFGGWAPRREIETRPAPYEPFTRPPAGGNAPGPSTASGEAGSRPGGWRRLFRRRPA